MKKGCKNFLKMDCLLVKEEKLLPANKWDST